MYENPINIFYDKIATEMVNKMNEETGDYVLNLVHSYGVDVNKEELIKALKYDREQYEKGYTEGRDAAFQNLKVLRKKVERLLYLETQLNTILGNYINDYVMCGKDVDIAELKDHLVYQIDEQLEWFRQGR